MQNLREALGFLVDSCGDVEYQSNFRFQWFVGKKPLSFYFVYIEICLVNYISMSEI